MTLDEYVAATVEQPWQWGKQDCTIWVADWCSARWGIDPAARYRGRYSDEQGMAALISGGLLATVAPEIALPHKDAPDEGDIGVIEVAGRQVAAIWSGAHWMFRTPRGVSFARRDALAIWGD